MQRPTWNQWLGVYGLSGALAERLLIVQRLIREALAAAPGDEVAVVSMCAGDGRDLLGVLADHERRDRVRARLVELDPANAARAAAQARELGLDRVEVVTGDAALTDAYVGAVPADVVLVCGIFGNIPVEDVRRTVAALPQFCARGATVIWTRYRSPPDLTPAIRGWFAEAGFAELAFESTAPDPPGPPWASPVQSVGANRWPHDPAPFEVGKRLFAFDRS